VTMAAKSERRKIKGLGGNYSPWSVLRMSVRGGLTQ
jgi:hypothetical protein